MRDLFIVGAGGFGREAIWTVERINSLSQQPSWRIIGYADDNPKWRKGDNFEGYPILGTVEEASRDYPGASVFIALGNNIKRDALGANRFGIRSVLLTWSKRYVYTSDQPDMEPTYRIATPNELLPLVHRLEAELAEAR